VADHAGLRGGDLHAELLNKLRSAPIVPLGPPEETLRTIINAQVALLRALAAAIADVETAITTRVAHHPRARLL
jgi:hypothetical protein